MSTLLRSSPNPEDICLQYSKSEQESIFASFENETEAAQPKPAVPTNTKFTEASKSADNIPEPRHIEKDLNSVENRVSKTISVQETSPFKQAVRGFVLNKWSKKVASSHILSGITEKLVKKLEEGKDISSSLTIEKSITIPQIKEPNSELSLEVIPCELKSVVANDLLHETSSVDEAIECFEETKSATNESKMFLKHRAVSRSLPSSPAHTFIRRASVDVIDNSSDNEDKSSVSEPLSVSAKLFQNTEPSAESNVNEIELVDINAGSFKEKSEFSKSYKNSDFNGYPENVYSGCNRLPEKPAENYTFRGANYTLRKIFLSIPVLHWLLLVSIIVHKYNFFSGYYVDDIFDASIIFYISFIAFTKMQKSIQTVPLYATYGDTKLETATIDLSKADESFQGSVKILKGNYDPDQQTVPLSELVSILIEDNCLKIFPPQPKDESVTDIPYEIYDLCGAKISLVPKGLTKKRIFSKRYPICITLPSAAKKVFSSSGAFDDLHHEEKSDFISLVTYEDGLVEMPTQRALYFFALTSREKESWYQALAKSIRVCDNKNSNQQNSPLCHSSRKFDVSAMSFSSLLETNSDDNLSITEDSCGTESEINVLPSDCKLSIEFADYMEIIWENYQRILHDSDDSLTSRTSQDPKIISSLLKNSTSVEWLNVAVGRIVYDFITQKKWCDEVMVRIQKKLDKIDLPNFVEPLTVTEVFMGTSVPQLHAVSSPTVDNFGIWFDFDFTYGGSFHMTLTTKLQIPKERQLNSSDVSENASYKQSVDASDTSEDESSGSKRSPKHKLINKIEKWVTHKHFQTVAQSRFVKKYVGDISNMPLTLTVEVNLLQGILALNLPPAPTDRIWYGFRKDPTLSLTATPKVGSHEINLSAVVQMIERKLKLAFKRAIVMPHMDDLIIPIMYTPVYDEES